MRIAISKSDPGYVEQAVAMKAIVHLDGVPQKSCTVADEEAGYVIRYKKLCVVGLPRHGEVPTEKVRGTVVISWPEGYTPPAKGIQS